MATDDRGPLAGMDETGSDTMTTSVRGARPGAAERSRKLRLAILAALIAALALASYAAYYYIQNHRLPIPRVVDGGRDTIQAPEFLYAFSGTARQAMTRPTGIAIIGDSAYVTDFAARSIRVYSTAGTFRSEFSAIKDGANTRLNSPVHIAVAPDGDLWVTDRRLKGIYIFTPQGAFVRKFVPDADPSFKWSPLGIAIAEDGTVFVTDVGDSKKHRVLVFAPDGKLKASWGKTQQVERVGDGLGNFLFPNGIAVTGSDSKAEVFVADGNNRRIQVFRPDGRFLRYINTSGTPRGIWLDAQRRLYVVDALAHRVDLYSLSGATLAGFGESGVGPGQFNFPNDVTLDGQGRIFITDRDNNQVQVWGFAKAEIPGITRIDRKSWWLCLLPLLLLLLPLALRRRKFVVTPDFVEAMEAAGLVPMMAHGRRRWIVPESDAPLYAGRVVDGISLEELLHPEPYSPTDARDLAARLKIDLERAGLLALAQRAKILCTQDEDIARLAVLLKVDVYDRETWIERFERRR